jgi:hypothetical protein
MLLRSIESKDPLKEKQKRSGLMFGFDWKRGEPCYHKGGRAGEPLTLEVGMSVCCQGTGTQSATMGPEIRHLYGQIELYTAQHGMEPPHLLSQCRSRDLQLAMQQAWDTGRRSGLRVRPADPENSNHIPDKMGICWAFDLSNDETWLSIVGGWVARTFPNATWGGTWLPRDTPHFQIDEHKRWRSAATFTI